VIERQAEGRADGQRRALLLVLETRFQEPVPTDLAGAIAEVDNVEELVRWIRVASIAETMSAFRSAVERSGEEE
jgi:hypothetical protein